MLGLGCALAIDGIMFEKSSSDQVAAHKDETDSLRHRVDMWSCAKAGLALCCKCDDITTLYFTSQPARLITLQSYKHAQLERQPARSCVGYNKVGSSQRNGDVHNASPLLLGWNRATPLSLHNCVALAQSTWSYEVNCRIPATRFS